MRAHRLVAWIDRARGWVAAERAYSRPRRNLLARKSYFGRRPRHRRGISTSWPRWCRVSSPPNLQLVAAATRQRGRTRRPRRYVHGINAIPVISGLTDLLLDPLDACAEAPILRAALARRPPAPPVAPEWQGFAAASLAAADAAAAWATAAALDEAAFDDGASKANLLHWIATARAKRKYAACDPALDNATVAPELPWNASGVDVSCEGNLACAALGLSGLCCPQLDGYMFGCCPVLKGEVPTAPPTTS